ncbi:MAG: Gfo/Idh/MocA family oxidoreductase [Candidatus Poribacteria bacterium]|nr:Gfo/Idh/MocA family oxidoreductase [Candidatus Poribacteria bacterium]
MSNQTTKVRAAVVGLGWPGMQHLKGYTADPRSEVIAVCDLDETQVEKVATEHKIPNTYTNHLEMLENKDIDAVSVCLPNFLHAPITIDTLKAGKHVLCEKPPARSALEAKAMADAAAENGKTLMYALVQRFDGSSQRLKRLVKAGELGDVYFGKAAYVRRRGIPIGKEGWFVDRERSGGGALIDIGVHALDCIWWLMNAPRPVEVMGRSYAHFGHLVPDDVKYDVDDGTFAQILFENGAIIILETTWALNLPGDNYIKIAGTKAGATLNPFTLYTEKDGKEVDKPLDAPSINGFDEEVKHFVECIVEDKTPISSAEQGIMLMQMLDGIYESSEKGRSVSITDLNTAKG